MLGNHFKFLNPKSRINYHSRPKFWSTSTSSHQKNLPGSIPRPKIKALLIDVSGNLHIGSTPTPGAVYALRRLVSAGIPFRLCSNTSKESTADLTRRLEEMGFEILETERILLDTKNEGGGNREENAPKKRRLIWTSIGAVAQALINVGSTSPYLLLSDSAREEVMKTLKPQARGQPELSDYDSVVIGLAPTMLTYEQLNIAFRLLKGETRPDAPHSESVTETQGGFNKSSKISLLPLIATHRAKYIQSSDGRLSLGPGPFVAALEDAVGTESRTKVVGKPEAAFFEMVINDFGNLFESLEEGEKIAVIGDDVHADLGGGAVALGLWRILVKTGKYRTGDEALHGVMPPDEIFDSFAAFVETLLDGQ